MPNDPVITFLTQRRSVSALALEDPAPDAETLAQILTIASRVPDHGKLGPWRFLLIEREAKGRYADALEALAATRPDGPKLIAALGKLRKPPLCVCVISSIRESQVPEWEQALSAGAVCMNLLNGALATGFGANWLTGWWSYDREAVSLLGLRPNEKVAGMMMIGTTLRRPDERPRPEFTDLTTRLEI